MRPSEAKEEEIELDGIGESDEEKGPRLKPAVENVSGLDPVAWRKEVLSILTNQTSYGSVGARLVELITQVDSSLGNFVRAYSSTQPPPASRPCYERKGDVLPLHPSSITTDLEGVDAENIHWVQATFMILNYYYCCGWSKPVCVPMDVKLGANQKLAIKAVAERVSRNIICAEPIPSPPKVKEMLNSKRYDYCGNPVEHMLDLDADKVIATWPAEGEAGVRCITGFLDQEQLLAVRDPTMWWLPDDRMPQHRTRSRVRATDETWFKICQAAHQRNTMKVVNDDQLHKDRNGHYITNGAGAVAKKKEINGKVVELQRFISILVPTNEHSQQLPGAQDSLPYVGQLSGIMLEETQDLYLDSEDLTSAFNLFAVPDNWLPHFAFEKKVDASAFGGKKGLMVRPALSVIPMGWSSAVALVQAAVRQIVFERCGVPRTTSVEKNKELPEGDHLSIVYLDNFGELRKIRKFGQEMELGKASPARLKFNEVCDKIGLSRNRGKQVIMSLTGGIQGGEIDGKTGIIKLASDKLRSFVAISLGMLTSESWREFHVRHWTGKAAFVAAFRRPLFSILEEIFPTIEKSQKGDVVPGSKSIDEVLSFLVLSVQAEADLRADMAREVSCTDASPTGGGSATATSFKDRSLQVGPAVEPGDRCACCQRLLENQEGRVKYPCPRACGLQHCSVKCSQAHYETGECTRSSISVAKFGERFSGPNYPLTKAVALEGGAVQKPLDIRIEENSWDFFTDFGRKVLDDQEEDPALRWRHWGPNCCTFSKARGRPMWVKGKGRMKGPPQVRDEEKPWGYEKARLSRDDQIKVRQDNKMAKTSLTGLDKVDRNGGYGGLEHPYGSYLWFTEEAEEISKRPGWHYTTWSHCCFGGRRTKWTSLLNNSRRVHAALDNPTCTCTHQEGYHVSVGEEGDLIFDTKEEAEYPWQFCRAYARAIVADLKDYLIPPMGTAVCDLNHMLYCQMLGATKGLQNEDLVYRIIQSMVGMLEFMNQGQEQSTFSGLAAR